MSPVININPDQALSFAPLDPGTYAAQITSVSEVTSGESGNQYVWLNYTVMEEPYVGRELRAVAMLEGKGVGMFIDIINTITGSEIAYDTPEDKEAAQEALHDFNTDDLIGVDIGILVKTVPDKDGEPRIEIKRVVSL